MAVMTFDNRKHVVVHETAKVTDERYSLLTVMPFYNRTQFVTCESYNDTVVNCTAEAVLPTITSNRAHGT